MSEAPWTTRTGRRVHVLVERERHIACDACGRGELRGGRRVRIGLRNEVRLCRVCWSQLRHGPVTP